MARVADTRRWRARRTRAGAVPGGHGPCSQQCNLSGCRSACDLSPHHMPRASRPDRVTEAEGGYRSHPRKRLRPGRVATLAAPLGSPPYSGALAGALAGPQGDVASLGLLTPAVGGGHVKHCDADTRPRVRRAPGVALGAAGVLREHRSPKAYTGQSRLRQRLTRERRLYLLGIRVSIFRHRKQGSL